MDLTVLVPIESQVNEVIPWWWSLCFPDWCCPRATGKAQDPGWVRVEGEGPVGQGTTEGRVLKIFLLRMKFFQFQFYVIR